MNKLLNNREAKSHMDFINMKLQIPTNVIRNEGYTVDEKSFAVYAYLLHKRFTNTNENKDYIEVNHIHLKETMGFSDNRILKKCFKVLYENKLIEELIEKFPVRSMLYCTIVNKKDDEYFTQLPAEVRLKANEIGCLGIRLLFYYESYVNRYSGLNKFCFASYETIIKDLKIGNATLTRYNDKLVKMKYLKITKHKSENGITDSDESRFIKFNNHYQVLIKNFK